MRQQHQCSEVKDARSSDSKVRNKQQTSFKKSRNIATGSAVSKTPTSSECGEQDTDIIRATSSECGEQKINR